MKNKKNVDHKKITVEIPYTTYLGMIYYCESEHYSGKKDLYYCDFVNLAILEYLRNH